MQLPSVPAGFCALTGRQPLKNQLVVYRPVLAAGAAPVKRQPLFANPAGTGQPAMVSRFLHIPTALKRID